MRAPTAARAGRRLPAGVRPADAHPAALLPLPARDEHPSPAVLLPAAAGLSRPSSAPRPDRAHHGDAGRRLPGELRRRHRPPGSEEK